MEFSVAKNGGKMLDGKWPSEFSWKKIGWKNHQMENCRWNFQRKTDEKHWEGKWSMKFLEKTLKGNRPIEFWRKKNFVEKTE